MRKTKIKDFKLNKESLLIIIFIGLLIFQSVSSMLLKSYTFDEGRYVTSSYRYLMSGGSMEPGPPLGPVLAVFQVLRGDLSLDPGHPPFLKLLVAMPLWFINRYVEGVPTHFPMFVVQPELLDKIVFWSRIPIVALSVILAIYVFKWTKELYGGKAGLFALFLYTFNPEILAHSRLATTDLGVSCFIFISLYYLWRFTDNPARRNLTLAAITFGLALLSKYSSIMLIPIFAIIAFSPVFSKKGLKPSTILIIILIGFIMVNLGYGFKESFTSLSEYEFRSESFSKASENKLISWVPVPLPSQYLKGLDQHKYEGEAGVPRFLMGEHSREGWLHYQIIAFLIKTPIPLLLFTLLSFVGSTKKNDAERYFLIFPIVFMFFIVSALKANVGLRHLLPIYPFIFVFVSRIVNLKFKRQSLFNVAVVFLAIWYFISSISIYPHYLAYFNGFIGGPENGHKYLIDSNIDWGQDDKLIKRYIEGSEVPVKASPLCGLITNGRIVINANRLSGMTKKHGECYKWLREFEPVDNVGYSWLVFDIKKEDLEEKFKSRSDILKGVWLYIGPFDNRDKRCFKEVYPPEKEVRLNKTYQGRYGEVNWRVHDTYLSKDLFALDFETLFDPWEYTVVYALTYVYSPINRKVQMRFGTLDTVTAWVNDEIVLNKEIYRDFKLDRAKSSLSSGYVIDRDIIEVNLLKGYNKILVKVCNGEGSDYLIFRITDTNGAPINDLVYTANQTINEI